MTPWRSNCSSAGDGMYTMGAMGYPQQYLWKRAWLGTMKLDDVLAGKNIDQGLAKQWCLYTYSPHNYQIEWYISYASEYGHIFLVSFIYAFGLLKFIVVSLKIGCQMRVRTSELLCRCHDEGEVFKKRWPWTDGPGEQWSRKHRAPLANGAKLTRMRNFDRKVGKQGCE